MNAPQRTEAWLIERAGHCTASRAADVLAKVQKGEAAGRKKYRIQVCTERLTGVPVQGYVNAAMQWGIDTEPSARAVYEEHTGEIVQEVGFIKHPTVAWVGASPDGCLGSDGLIEVKCPESTTHLEWTAQERVPPEHVSQIQFQLWVTGRQYCDFVSYDPRFPEHMRLFIVRTARDDKFIEGIALEVGVFLKEVSDLYEKLMARSPLVQAIDPNEVGTQP